MTIVAEDFAEMPIIDLDVYLHVCANLDSLDAVPESVRLEC
jgi:hypothetical protein